MEQVFFSRHNRSLIDFVRPDGRGVYSGKTETELREGVPDLAMLPTDEAQREIESMFVTAPQVISSADYFEGLGVMPPMKCRSGQGGSSFMWTERQYGKITRIYVCAGDQHFMFHDLETLTQAEILARVEPYLTKKPDPRLH